MNINMRYGAIFKQPKYDLEKALKEAKLKEYKLFLGRIMRSVLKLGSAEGIDESYKRAIKDITIAIGEEVENMDKENGS
jgi:hypothetical protein